MVAEIIPEAYDVFGKRTFYPGKKRFGFFAPNAAMGRHLTGDTDSLLSVRGAQEGREINQLRDRNG